MAELRNRKGAVAAEPVTVVSTPKVVVKPPKKSNAKYFQANLVLTVLAFLTRFIMLSHPDEVVFDEVHFGKFASYYLQRTYFFDLHPPFAKLLIAAVGWLIGYDGSFKFENIGENYIANNVPYVAYRALSASLGSLTVPIIFKTLQYSGYSVAACTIGAAIVCLDNAHINDSRLILLDATLNVSVAMSIFCYVRFSNQRKSPFSLAWWTWLFSTGIALSCTISTKYVGVFTFMTVGGAVIYDLWNLLDYEKSGLSMKEFIYHFGARAYALILVPLVIYLAWFQVHFMVLNRSGPGDAFMSPDFQETLGDNFLAQQARDIEFYDIVRFKHKGTGAFLHSHEARYPLRYEDGRISSQGQQVTGYSTADPNNAWQILPEKDFPEDQRVGHPVYGSNKVRFRHLATNTYLLTHDVASPYFPTNQEFTTVSPEVAAERYNETVFEVRLNSGKSNNVRTKAAEFKLIHDKTKVAMWTHKKLLPEWGFGQFEINGNKNTQDPTTTWTFDEIVGLSPERASFTPKKTRQIPFIQKYLELQGTMFRENNALTASHPYASEPITWPFLIRGVSFWTNAPNRAQIYFHGNFVGWYIEDIVIALFVGAIAADQFMRKRQITTFGRRASSKLYHSMGFFFLAWSTHFFPFFLMGRQKFLHHYLPAHLCAALLAGAGFDFIFGEFDRLDEEANASKKDLEYTQRQNKPLQVATITVLILLTACFLFFCPLTYGLSDQSVQAIKWRQWMKFELHFSK